MARFGRAQPPAPFIGRVPRATVAGTLNLQGAGMELIARTGLAVSTFAREVAVNYRIEVYAHGGTMGSPLYTSGVLVTDSAGKLPNVTNAALVPGATVRVLPIRQSDLEAGYPRTMVVA